MKKVLFLGLALAALSASTWALSNQSAMDCCDVTDIPNCCQTGGDDDTCCSGGGATAGCCEQ